MKKIFLVTAFVAGSWTLFAQDSTGRNNNGTGNQTGTQTTGTANQNNGNNSSNATNGNPSMNNGSTNGTMNDGTMSNTNNQTYNSTSTTDYSAYGIPNYVQQNFETAHPGTNSLMWDRPTADWYHGYYMDNGHYTHVYYSTDPYYNSTYYPERVTGYNVSLPVLQTYVPDQIISTAINQYKQNLYDITAIKGNNSQNLYQVRVLDNGQLRTMWIDSTGTSTADVYRTDMINNMPTNSNTINSTQSNAAMDNSNSNMSDSSGSTTNSSSDMGSGSSMNTHGNSNHASGTIKTKKKTTTADGHKIITKTKNGKSKTWTENNNKNNQQ